LQTVQGELSKKIRLCDDASDNDGIQESESRLCYDASDNDGIQVSESRLCYDASGNDGSQVSESRLCDDASGNDGSQVSEGVAGSEDEHEDESSAHESEGSEFNPEEENDGDKAQEDDDSMVGSLDSNDEALAEETQQYALYVGYWDDFLHIVDFQLRSKLEMTLAIIVNQLCKVMICKGGRLSWTRRMSWTSCWQARYQNQCRIRAWKAKQHRNGWWSSTPCVWEKILRTPKMKNCISR
jgi:hypothetical protein